MRQHRAGHAGPFSFTVHFKMYDVTILGSHSVPWAVADSAADDSPLATALSGSGDTYLAECGRGRRPPAANTATGLRIEAELGRWGERGCGGGRGLCSPAE
jgi:hypothetical protein